MEIITIFTDGSASVIMMINHKLFSICREIGECLSFHLVVGHELNVVTPSHREMKRFATHWP